MKKQVFMFVTDKVWAVNGNGLIQSFSVDVKDNVDTATVVGQKLPTETVKTIVVNKEVKVGNMEVILGNETMEGLEKAKADCEKRLTRLAEKTKKRQEFCPYWADILSKDKDNPTQFGTVSLNNTEYDLRLFSLNVIINDDNGFKTDEGRMFWFVARTNQRKNLQRFFTKQNDAIGKLLTAKKAIDKDGRLIKEDQVRLIMDEKFRDNFNDVTVEEAVKEEKETMKKVMRSAVLLNTSTDGQIEKLVKRINDTYDFNAESLTVFCKIFDTAIIKVAENMPHVKFVVSTVDEGGIVTAKKAFNSGLKNVGGVTDTFNDALNKTRVYFAFTDGTPFDEQLNGVCVRVDKPQGNVADYFTTDSETETPVNNEPFTPYNEESPAEENPAEPEDADELLDLIPEAKEENVNDVLAFCKEGKVTVAELQTCMFRNGIAELGDPRYEDGTLIATVFTNTANHVPTTAKFVAAEGTCFVKVS